MDAFVQTKTFRVLLLLILVALLVFAISLQLEPRRAAASAAEPKVELGSTAQETVSPATTTFGRPAEIRDQPSLIDGF